jgi:arylsulfatase
LGKHGVPFTGVANATPEIKALADPLINGKQLPFDVFEYVEHLDQVPY